MLNAFRQATRYSVGSLSSVKNSKSLLQPGYNPISNSSQRLFVRNLNMARALVIVADGTEEMEAVITTDILRRGKVSTTVAGLNSAEAVKCGCGVKLLPDVSLDEALKHEYDAVILPGGLAGSEAFCASLKVGQLLKKQEAAGKYCAAICAAPTAFKAHGIGLGKTLTSYPSMADKFKGTNYKYIEDHKVVVDGKLVTSRGPGTAFDFGLKLVELLVDKKTSDEIKAGMLVQ